MGTSMNRKKGPSNDNFSKDLQRKGELPMQLLKHGEILKFDPAKDDVEEFITNIKNLAGTLEFNEEAQIMAIKSNMPRDVYRLCMQYDKLGDLKKFLIELFANLHWRVCQQ